MTPIFERYREAYSGLSRDVWFLAITLLINRCGSMVLAFLALYMAESQGYDESVAGIAFGVYGAGAIAGAYLGGRLTQNFGAIRIQTVCLFLAVPGFFIIPWCENLTQLLSALFYLSVATEAVRPANSTAVALFASAESQTRAFALQRLAANLGLSIGPAIGGFLAEVDFNLLFWVDGLTTLAGAMAFLAFFRMRRFANQSEVDIKNQNERHRSPMRDWQFVTLWFLLLITAIVFFQYHVTYPLYLRQQYHLDKWTIGLLFAVNTVMVVLFEMVLVEYVKKWPMLKVIAVGCFLACFGFGILSWGAGILPPGAAIGFCIFSAIIITMGEMLAMPIATGWVAKRSAGKNQGVYMGWYAMTYSVACVIGPVAGSQIYGTNRDLIWDLSLVAAFVVLVGFYFFIRAVNNESESQSVHPEKPSTRIHDTKDVEQPIAI